MTKNCMTINLKESHDNYITKPWRYAIQLKLDKDHGLIESCIQYRNFTNILSSIFYWIFVYSKMSIKFACMSNFLLNSSNMYTRGL